MPALLPYRFRSELAREFHRSITNTRNVASSDLNSLTPTGNTVYVYIATAGQTTFSGSDSDSKTLSYTPGRIAVYVNGVQLGQSDYTATNGTSVVLDTGASLNQNVVIVTYDVYTYPNPSDYYYVFLGRTTSWTNDASAPTPTDTREAEAQTRRDLMAVKRVQPNDAVLMIDRNNWTTSTIYSAYDSDVVLQNLANDFFVLNSSYRIYKCVYSPGTASTVQPTSTSVGPVTLADGYKWQFMYEVPVGDRTKFLTADYIPVRFTSTSSAFDHNGTVMSATITSAGSGYLSAPTVTILGDGVGATATATIAAGGVNSITITNGGEGYSYALVAFSGGSGSGAVATASLTTSDVPNPLNIDVAANASVKNGAIEFVNVVSGGTGYTGSTVINVTGDGTGLEVTPTVSGGVITGVTVTNPGSGYTYATLTPTIGAGASLQAVISPQGGHGSDVPKELLARVVGIVTSIEDVASDFFLNNNFRQFGLIKNIKQYENGTLFSSNTGNAAYVVTVPSGTPYTVDDILTTAAGGRFIVTYKTGTTLHLLPIIDDEDLTNGSVVENETTPSGSTLTLTTVTPPEIDVHTGDIVYLQNITPVTRQSEQVEKIKLYFSF